MTDETKDAVMSHEMLKNCKNDIAKFGFDRKNYIEFLKSVYAMKDENTVCKFPNNEIEEYREKFIKKNEYGIGDQFQFDKCKISKTGYFCPRSFWDKILETKLD